MGMWVFVPKAELGNVEHRLRTLGVATFRVTMLEEVPFPPWNERFR